MSLALAAAPWRRPRQGRPPRTLPGVWLRLAWLAVLAALLAASLGLAPGWGQARAADGLVPVPPLQARMTDLTGTLTPQQQAALEQTLRDFEARKGTQVAVLMLPSTKPEEIEQYSLRVVEQWKLGRKKVDDGALLLIAKDDHAMRIEVGYGLEGALNDATAKRIIAETITPRFRDGDFHTGISAGVAQMLKVLDGEPLPPPARSGRGQGAQSLGDLLPMLLVAAVVVGSVLRAVLGRLPGAVLTGGLLGVAGWWLGATLATVVLGGVIAFFITLLGISFGRFGGFYGGGSGGRSGGGFSGGGGGFGGGGASGRW